MRKIALLWVRTRSCVWVPRCSLTALWTWQLLLTGPLCGFRVRQSCPAARANRCLDLRHYSNRNS